MRGGDYLFSISNSEGLIDTRQVIMFGPGDGLFIPAGEKHKHKGRVLTDVVKIILVEDI